MRITGSCKTHSNIIEVNFKNVGEIWVQIDLTGSNFVDFRPIMLKKKMLDRGRCGQIIPEKDQQGNPLEISVNELLLSNDVEITIRKNTESLVLSFSKQEYEKILARLGINSGHNSPSKC